MKLKDIIEFLDNEIPKELALENDNIAFQKKYDLNQEITLIKIFMDLYPEDDIGNKNTLIITHHPPLFIPKTPTYTIHSNWDIIEGGANEALACKLKLKVVSYFDDKINIGRICDVNSKFKYLKKNIINNFENARIVNNLDDDEIIDKVGIISGFGLKNSEYIKLASKKKIKILISGDLIQETAILAKNLNITLIDLGHHESEIPGLYALAEIIQKININCIVINKKPIEKL